MIKINYEECIIKIGKNEKENWNLLDNADIYDIIFHLKDTSSAYVLLEYNIKKYSIDTIPECVINECCKLLKTNSKRTININKKLPIIYDEKENIKKGKKMGQLIYDNNSKTIVN